MAFYIQQCHRYDRTVHVENNRALMPTCQEWLSQPHKHINRLREIKLQDLPHSHQHPDTLSPFLSQSVHNRFRGQLPTPIAFLHHFTTTNSCTAPTYIKAPQPFLFPYLHFWRCRIHLKLGPTFFKAFRDGLQCSGFAYTPVNLIHRTMTVSDNGTRSRRLDLPILHPCCCIR